MDKEQLTKEALELLLEWARASGDFVKEQAPALADEIVNLGLVSYGFAAVVSGLVFCSMVLAVWVMRKKFPDEKDFWPDDAGSTMCLSIVFAIPFLIGVYNLSCLVSVWFAPRLYVLQEVQKLLK